MTVWEVHGSFEMCRLINRRVKMPFNDTDGPFNSDFGIDGVINLIAKNGNVYQVRVYSNRLNLIEIHYSIFHLSLSLCLYVSTFNRKQINRFHQQLVFQN